MEQTASKSVKWKMVDKNNFTGELDGYVIAINPPPYWSIFKDGIMVDSCFYHSPSTGELQAKVQSERALNNLLKTSIQNL